MTVPSKHERKKLFAKINGSLKEYSTNEDINTLESVKDEILQLLKTHRPIKRCDYEYGLSRALKKDHRLIIKELADKSKVREYNINTNSWYCLNRNASHYKCKASVLQIQYSIVFAPIDHDDKCKTRDYSYVMKIQGLLKQGKVSKAHGLALHGKKNRKNTSIPSSSSSPMLDESALLNADQDDSSIPEQPSSTTAASIASTNTQELPQVSSPPPAANLLESATSSSVKRERNNVVDDCMILEEPATKKPKDEEKCITVNTFKFNCPSSTVLKQKCEKLKIRYNAGVYKLWGEIVISSILPVANNIHAHSIKSQNIFACLALLFTGKTNDCFLIQHAINEAFREHLTAKGTKSSEEIEEILLYTIVSDEQIEFMAKFLSCRIGIYYDGALKKFGKWEREEKEDILTLILLFYDGCFSIVLDLSVDV